jgi:hypothetical protein
MINAYTSWQPLQEVIVGRVYSYDYFEYIEDRQVRNQLQQILYETEEDLKNLSDTIKSFGATVHRPGLLPKDQFIESQLKGDVTPLPPLTPRDWQISLGQKLLRIIPMIELDSICSKFYKQIVNPHQDSSGPRYKSDCILNGASASCIVRVGRDVFFDNSEWLKPDQSRWIIDNVLGSEYRIHEAVTDGHSDAVFAILKPGVILTSKHDENIDLSKEFPGWDVYKILDSSIDAAIRVGEFKQENFNGRWYVQGQTPTPEFASFVDTYLKNWVGYVKETVFDVNCLVLDEQHVIFSAYNRDVFDFCKKHHIEPIICPLRHSYFWDGGISCCTQDLTRRGGLESYL